MYSTKFRAPLIGRPVQGELHRYLGGALKGLGCLPFEVGGVEDHVHLLFSLSRTVTIAKVVEKLKTGSSRWLKSACEEFEWQGGYGAFSVHESDIGRLRRYIANQAEHHRRKTYHDELLKLLDDYGIAYDERYLWD